MMMNQSEKRLFHEKGRRWSFNLEQEGRKEEA